MRKIINANKILVENTEEKEVLKDLDAGGERIIQNLFLRKWVVWLWGVLNWLGMPSNSDLLWTR
jgi:hypothetical protein